MEVKFVLVLQLPNTAQVGHSVRKDQEYMLRIFEEALKRPSDAAFSDVLLGKEKLYFFDDVRMEASMQEVEVRFSGHMSLDEQDGSIR